MTVLASIAFQPEGPQPLVREIPAGESYPVEALGPLKAVVDAVHDMTEAPSAIAAQSALAVASLATQAFANVETLGGNATQAASVPLSLYFLTIAKSGERKSGCDRKLMVGLREHEYERAVEHREAMSKWRMAHKLWCAKRDRYVKEAANAKGEKAVAAEADLQALGDEPVQPLEPQLTATDPTIEGLFKLYHAGQPSLGLFSDEAGSFLGGYSMSADNRMKTLSGLSTLWDGHPFNRTRAGDGAATLYGRRMAMHLMGQPIVIQPLLSDPIANGQGFIPRLLLTEPPTTIGSRFKRGHAESSERALAVFSKRLSELLEAPKPTSEDSEQELKPRLLPLSNGARELLFALNDKVEAGMAKGGPYEMVRGFACKTPEQAARIAGVLTLWTDLNAPCVTQETMTDAVKLAIYYLGEAKRLVDVSQVSEETDKAERLRLWLIESWPRIAAQNGRDPATVLPKDVAQFGPYAMRETKDAKRFMAVLAAHGWIVELPQGTVVDGSARGLAYQVVVL